MISRAGLRVGGFLFAAALTAACSSGGTKPHPSPTFSASAVASQVTMADAKRCPVTLPRPFDPPPGVSQDDLFGSPRSYGNGKLWVGGLWPKGVIVGTPDFIEPDGSVGMKFGWWREVSGLLSITGRRLDATARPLRADVPSGYGMKGFQASGVHFPTEGCWEVIGRVGTTTLTFVTFVVKRAA